VLYLHFAYAALIPLLILLAALSFFLHINISENVYRENQTVGTGVAREIGVFHQHIDSVVRLLGGLAAANEDGYERINGILVETIDRFPDFETIQFMDQEGVIKATAPFNGDLIGSNMSSQEFFQDLKTDQGEVLWSDTFVSAFSGEPTFAVALSTGRGILVGYIDLSRMKKIARQITELGVTELLITDRTGTVIVHPDQRKVQQQYNLKNEVLVAETLSGSTGTREAVFEGRTVLGSTFLVEPTGWAVLVMQNREEVFRPLWRTISWLVIFIILSGLLGLGLAFFSRQKIVRPIYELMERTRRFASGSKDEDFSVAREYREIHYLAKTLSKMSREINKREEELQRNIAEKEILIREVHHRVKNNLQLILSILNLKYTSIEEEEVRQEMYDSIGRIYTIAQVHEQLYSSEHLDQINISGYIQTLTTYLFSIDRYRSRNAQPHIEVSEVYLQVEKAIPLGLIFFELISNSLQHASLSNGNSRLEIRIQAEINQDRELKVNYSDDGEGFEPTLFYNASTVGFSIINELVRQLGGRIDYRSDGRNCFELFFPL